MDEFGRITLEIREEAVPIQIRKDVAHHGRQISPRESFVG